MNVALTHPTRNRWLTVIFLALLLVLPGLRSAGAAASAPCRPSDEVAREFTIAAGLMEHFDILFGHLWGDVDISLNLEVDRGLAAKMLASALGQNEDAKLLHGAPVFHDLGDHWAGGYVAVLYREEIVKGYPDGTFRISQHLTMDELHVLLARLLKLPGADTPDAARAQLEQRGVNLDIPCRDPAEMKVRYFEIILLLDRAMRVPLPSVPTTAG